MSLIEIFENKRQGRLFAVGDLHGMYNLLMLRLEQIGFDFEHDLLISVGDLVDRGTQNMECIELLSKPWFKSVRGNHEDLCIWGRCDEPSRRCHLANGGEWFYELSIQEQYQIAKKFAALAIALEVHHKGSRFGFVHGHIEQNDWAEFKQTLENPFMKKQYGRSAQDLAIWGRERFDSDESKYKKVTGIDAVILGHTVTPKPVRKHNCYYIDTGAVHWGTLTILNLSS